MIEIDIPLEKTLQFHHTGCLRFVGRNRRNTHRNQIPTICLILVTTYKQRKKMIGMEMMNEIMR